MKYAKIMPLVLALMATGCTSMSPVVIGHGPVAAVVSTAAALTMYKPTPCAKKAKKFREDCQSQRDRLNQAIANADKGN